MDPLTEDQMKLVRRIAGGKQASPKVIRDAAIRIMTGFEDEYDYKIVTDYIDNL